MDLSTVSKAIAGGLGTLVVAELAKYGFHPDEVVVNALGVLETAVVSYVVGHTVVYFAPRNKEGK